MRRVFLLIIIKKCICGNRYSELAIPVAFERGFFATKAVYSFLAVKQKTIAADSSNSAAETAQSNISQSDTANNSNAPADNANEQASASPAAPAESASQEAQGITFAVIGDTDSTADDTPQKNLTDFGLSGHYYAIVSVNGKTVDLKIYSLDGNVVKDYSFTS